MVMLDTFMRLSGIIAPNALLVVVGWLLGRMGRIPTGEVMAPLLTDVATPCLVLSIFTHMQLAPHLLISVGLGAVASLAIFLLASDALLRVTGLCPRTYLGPLSFPNTGNLGIPLSGAAYGPVGLATATVFYAVTSIANGVFGQALAAGHADWRRIGRMPLVYASLVSAVIIGTGFRLPHIAEDAISLAGQMAIPLMLLSLGAAMARLDVPATALCCGLAAFRLCFGAGVGCTVAWAFGLTGATRAAFVLQASMPVAINSYLFAERWDSEPHKVAALVTASTLGSCATTPALLLLLG